LFFAVLGSLICDLMTAASCGELHLVWLYVVSCTEFDRNRNRQRGRVSYLNKILKLFIESIPVWMVRSVFIYQTYMKYQSDRQLDAASITSLNLTNATVLSITQNKNTTTSTVSYSQTGNPFWLLEYGIVFLSFLGTVGNMLKNFYSIGKMIQYNWNHIEEFKYIELKGGKVTHKAQKPCSTWKSSLITFVRQYRLVPQLKDDVEVLEIQQSIFFG
jgi:hypothetical protein